MVQEEAYLRGYLKLPAGAPDFYEGFPYWCNTRWIGPARGYIDPTKEIKANIDAIENGLMSRSEAIAERGGDFDEITEQIAREQEKYRELGLKIPAASQSSAINASENLQQAQINADTENNNEEPQDTNNAQEDATETASDK